MSKDLPNIAEIRRRIANAAARCGRDPHAIKLMAVTKTVAVERIKEAVDAGITLFGENYVQEAREKITALGKNVQWHMIGRLQTNKAKYVVLLFDCGQSVDRIELALELDKRARLAGYTSTAHRSKCSERNKSGTPPRTHRADKKIGLWKYFPCASNDHAPYSDNAEDSRPYFRA